MSHLDGYGSEPDVTETFSHDSAGRLVRWTQDRADANDASQSFTYACA